MPFEGAPHRGSYLAWPGRKSLWGDSFETVQQQYAGVASAIAEFEPVTVLVPPNSLGDASVLLPNNATIHELPLDDSWIRDNGPTLIRRADGGRAAVGWRFNAWGAKHSPWDNDALAAARLADRLEVPLWPAPVTTEGGAIHSDGEGTLLVTETSILNPNRNPGLTRDDAGRILCDATGAEMAVWLPGDAEEIETDGHVDLIAAFVAPGVVIHEAVGPDNPRRDIVLANIAALKAARDAQGRAFDLVELPEARSQSTDSEVQCRSYVNFYLVNGGVIVPGYGVPEDQEAVSILKDVFPDRKIVQMPCDAIAAGGGAVHCITQQIPD